MIITILLIGGSTPCVGAATPLRPDQTLLLGFPASSTNSPACAMGLMFSADGKTLTALDASHVVSWDAWTGAETYYEESAGFLRLVRGARDVLVISGTPGTSSCVCASAAAGATKTAFVMPSQALPGGSDSRKTLRYPSYMLPKGTHSDAYVGPWAVSPLGGRAACVASLPNAQVRAAFSEGVWIFNSLNGEVVQRLAPPKDPDSSRVVDRSIVNDPFSIRDIAFSPDGRNVAATAFTGTIVVWSCADGKVLHTLPGQPPHDLSWPLRILQPGEMSTASISGQLLWSDGSSALLTLAPRPDLDAPGLRRLVNWSLVSSTSKTLEWIGAKSGVSMKQQATLARSSAEAAGSGVPQGRFVVASPDGNRAIVVLEESQPNHKNFQASRPGLELVDLSGDRAIGLVFVRPKDWISSIAFSPDSSRVALATRLGFVVILPLSDLEEFAAHQRSIDEMGSTRPAGAKRIAGVSTSSQVPGSSSPAAETTQSSAGELFGTGVHLKTELDVVQQYDLPREREPAPRSLLIAGSAIVIAHVEPHASYKQSASDFKAAGLSLDPREQSAEGAFKPFLESRCRALGREFIHEIVPLTGGPCHVYSLPANEHPAEDDLFHWEEMYAVVQGDTKDVRIDIVYPQARASELRAPLHAMLVGLVPSGK